MSTHARRPQLITYPDSLGGSLRSLATILETRLTDTFRGGVHVLPPFPSSADRGFAPIRYDRVDPRFGDWSDLQQIARFGPLTLDVMVNHISRHSPEFHDFAQYGRTSRHDDMFLRLDKFWPDGDAPVGEVEAIFLRKPKHPFIDVTISGTGATERVWATFGVDEHDSNQIDLDWRSPLTTECYQSWFASLASAGASEVRLDAVGYLTKRPGTSCFMVEPDVWDLLDQLAKLAAAHGLTVLPEIHAEPAVVASVAAHGYPAYDFIMPGLIVHTIWTRSADTLIEHLATLPATTVTTLDTHDGIPIQPDLIGVLSKEDLVELVDGLVDRGANVSRILEAETRGIDFDAHQVNISYLDAVGGADALVMARAIQLFSPGRAQVYYQGLLGGSNDYEAVVATGEGRAINRSDYPVAVVDRMLESAPAARQRRLIELRSQHSAFGALRPTISQHSPSAFSILWEHEGATCRLDVDLTNQTAFVTASPSGNTPALEWAA